MRPSPCSPLLLVTLVGLMIGCSPNRVAKPDPSQTDRAIAAYRSYADGDCAQVRRVVKNADRERWPAGEARASLRLVGAYCREQAGDTQSAFTEYRRIVRESPLSFASEDARERLRVLRLFEDDPDYATWLASSRERAQQGSTERAALERSSAAYPPLGQAAGLGGTVVVEFGVLPSGVTDAPVVVDANPPLLFDGVALRAVRSWRYAPDPAGTQSRRQAIRLVFRAEDQSGTALEEENGAKESREGEASDAPAPQG